jgi:hypothetical protein
MFRVPAGLHRRIVQKAEKDGRSLNQEMVRRLEESFRHDAAADSALERAEAALAEMHVRAGELTKAWEDRFAALAANVADSDRIIKRLLAEKITKAENEK